MSDAEKSFPNFCYADELGIRLNPCIEIIAFTDAKLIDGPHQGMLNFYNAFRRRFGDQMTWYQTNTDNKFKKIKPGKLDIVPFWLEDERNKKQNLLGIEFKAGKLPNDMQLPSFEFFCQQAPVTVGVFHMGLPLEVGFESLSGMLPLVQEALQNFPLHSGYFGYSFYWDTLDFRFEEEFYKPNIPRIYMRHPGIGEAGPRRLFMRSAKGLMGISWLTLLGPRALATVGGIEILKNTLVNPTLVLPLACIGNGALVAAGPRPLIGDLSVGNDLPLYKAVGRALRKASFPPEDYYCRGMSDDASTQWFARFFDEN